jgi:hypothetical protein
MSDQSQVAVSVRQIGNPLLGHLGVAYFITDDHQAADLSFANIAILYCTATYLTEFPLYLKNRFNLTTACNYVLLLVDDGRDTTSSEILD